MVPEHFEQPSALSTFESHPSITEFAPRVPIRNSECRDHALIDIGHDVDSKKDVLMLTSLAVQNIETLFPGINKSLTLPGASQYRK